MPRYHCLIPDVCDRRVLAVPSGDGHWTLPAFEQDIEWFAYASTAIARNATEHYGVALTALREHSAADCRVCELEVQVQHWMPPVGTRWIASADLPMTALEPAGLLTILQAWFLEQETGTIPIIRPSWERRGWYLEAVDWILSECSRLGFALSGPVEQLKASWSLSCILRVNTSTGFLYFKADFPKPPSEPAIIEALARRWPHNVPNVIAADRDRGWMLMRDFGEHSLDREPIAQWEGANRTFSAIQVACSADLAPWWRLQCSDLRIPILVTCMDRLLEDPAALRIDEPDGLTTSDVARLRKATVRLHDMWTELAAIPIPSSIVQQDFRHANLVISGSSYVFYDWSDTVISHPFFACCRFLDYVRGDPLLPNGLSMEDRRSRIADAYLQPWAEIVRHTDLRRAFELACQLNPIYVAIRRYLDVPDCEPTSSWGRVMRKGSANELRRWLTDMDE